MRPASLILIGIVILTNSCLIKTEKLKAGESIESREINFYISDSIKIFGDLYEIDKEKPTVLLFHQGGSNARGEYMGIIPELVEKEFNVLAIDQRMGGQIYGSYNRTLAEISDHSFTNPYSYCDAYNNLEGALDFIIENGFKGEKILWGSSYSAALAIQLAHQRQTEVVGVLAFSPASSGPMEECNPNQYFETLTVPCLLLRPPGEMENEKAREQFELARKYKHQTYVPKYGTHGSSMLVSSRVGKEVSETWAIVSDFLNRVVDR